MTNKDLAAFGERLYAAIINTSLSTIEIGGLAAAFRTRTPWPRLGPSLKVALFRIAAKVGEQPIPEPALDETEISDGAAVNTERSGTGQDEPVADDAEMVGAPAEGESVAPSRPEERAAPDSSQAGEDRGTSRND